MAHTRPTVPAGHGELVERPPRSEWIDLMHANRAAAAGWTFDVAGVPVGRYRRAVRTPLLRAASSFSARLGVEVRGADDPDAPLAMTGHQPELYHPGVWVKDFELEGLARSSGCQAIDVVVDTDGFDHISLTSPCTAPVVTRCRQYLALGTKGSSYAMAPVPRARDIEQFCSATMQALSTLSAPAIARHFSAFCAHLQDATTDAHNLAELLTIARRRYEASAGTGYLEVMLTSLCASREFAGFVVELALDAQRFVRDYNSELDAYRQRTRTRSAAQPFPDLATEASRFELPLWLVTKGRRVPVWAGVEQTGVTLLAEGETVITLPADPVAATQALADSGLVIAPKALALTLFVRMFCADLFIHGIGGGRYDQVTDGVIRRYFGVEPPVFVVSSMTMYLPLGARLVSADEVARAKERVHKLTHNPDALLAEIDFDSESEKTRLAELAARKSELVARIATPGADKKTLGIEIKRANAAMAEILSPVKAALVDELAAVESQYAASEVLTDRTYPFCFWDPREVADKVW